MRYYIRINFLPEPRDDTTLAGRCISILHGVINRYGYNDIAVAFPEWNENAVGSSIAFVSQNPEQLSLLVSQKYFKEMASFKYFDIQPLKLVEEGGEEVAFVRTQAADKATGSRRSVNFKRLAKRAELRGEVYKPRADSYRSTFNHFHKIPITSKGSEKSFELNIELIKIKEKSLGVINNYGLSKKTGTPTSVPKELK
ncbi:MULTISPECIES: type I-F CRISPR-associated endoribonuclease Cas6/Csy4 [unclassified Marinomonas]|uniref:type I-F CRISPR-associated endoribonuclease Cas6/Csy4 n=1 Tax=unclassified Marinomonas TaxID=196814 RepID=UPI000A45AAA8|nr:MULTISPECIES: type I-F CRISPR-associated endoribonuclease Cas6/Csy4 [unclassified Marinomonas]